MPEEFNNRTLTPAQALRGPAFEAIPPAPAAATVAETLATFSAGVQFEGIPTPVVETAKLHLLDTLGCGLAAYALGIGAEGSAVALSSRGASTIIGRRELAAAPAAALANGMLCHGLDFDDTHPGSICHIGTVVFPAALAAAESVDADGRATLTALVAGSEVVARLGGAAAGEYMVRGFHPTSVFGVFGAAAAAGRLFGWRADTLGRSLGLAGSMASGLFEYLEDGSSAKILHAGWAAHAGLMAAELAGFGASGPSSVIEGRFGVLRAFFGVAPDSLAILNGLGEHWETTSLAFKPFPACHFIHSPVDAAAQVTLGRAVQPGDIDEVVVLVPPPAVPLVLEPRGNKIAPRTSYDAKFSLQYSVAAMLVRGRLGVSDYTPEAICDPTVLDLAARVTYRVTAFPSFPSSLPGGIEIHLTSGEVLTCEIPHQRGGVENPLLLEEIVGKFRENAALALPDSAVARLETAILSLEQATSVSSALAPLREAKKRGG